MPEAAGRMASSSRPKRNRKQISVKSTTPPEEHINNNEKSQRLTLVELLQERLIRSILGFEQNA